MNHAGLHDCQRPERLDRVGQTLEPVTQRQEHVYAPPVLQIGESGKPVFDALTGGESQMFKPCSGCLPGLRRWPRRTLSWLPGFHTP